MLLLDVLFAKETLNFLSIKLQRRRISYTGKLLERRILLFRERIDKKSLKLGLVFGSRIGVLNYPPKKRSLKSSFRLSETGTSVLSLRMAIPPFFLRLYSMILLRLIK